MNKLIICTTGTSIANQCPAQKEMFKQHNEWESDAKLLQSQIHDYLIKTKHQWKHKEIRRKICAEINTLDRIGINTDDRIILLASDTSQGRVCAEMIKDAIIDAYHLDDLQVEVRRIEGLQAHHAKILREQGLKNLVKVALEYLANEQIRYSYDIILNTTGGFKGIVPFLSILGMLYGKRTVYIFEFANELISLPPLPFSFDINLYNRVKYALAFIDKNVAVTEHAFLNKIENFSASERDLFMAFTEPFDNRLITLSPLAYCLLMIEGEARETVYISQLATESIGKCKGVSEIIIKRLLSNVGNPLWRSQHIKRWNTTDLLIVKQSRTAERIAGFIKEGVFYVTHVFSNHDDYESLLGSSAKKDYDKTTFTLWFPEEDYGVNEENRDSLAAERDRLLLEKQALSKKVKELEAQLSL